MKNTDYELLLVLYIMVHLVMFLFLLGKKIDLRKILI